MKFINLGSHVAQDVPRVRFRPSLLDHLLEVAAFLPVLATWIYILYYYRQSGGEVPSDLYQTGGMALFVFILLGVVGYCPIRFINFPFRVGPHNVVIQYLLALRLCRVLNIILCLLHFFIALSGQHTWAHFAGLVCLGLLILSLAGYMALAYSRR